MRELAVTQSLAITTGHLVRTCEYMNNNNNNNNVGSSSVGLEVLEYKGQIVFAITVTLGITLKTRDKIEGIGDLGKNLNCSGHGSVGFSKRKSKRFVETCYHLILTKKKNW